MPIATITNRNQSPSAVNLRRALQPPIRAARFFLVGLDDMVRILSDWIDRIPASPICAPAALVQASVLRCGNPNGRGTDQRRASRASAPVAATQAAASTPYIARAPAASTNDPATTAPMKLAPPQANPSRPLIDPAPTPTLRAPPTPSGKQIAYMVPSSGARSSSIDATTATVLATRTGPRTTAESAVQTAPSPSVTARRPARAVTAANRMNSPAATESTSPIQADDLPASASC